MTDINLGVFTARLDPGRSISATSEKMSIRYHTYEEVRFKDSCAGYSGANGRSADSPSSPPRKRARSPRPKPARAH